MQIYFRTHCKYKWSFINCLWKLYHFDVVKCFSVILLSKISLEMTMRIITKIMKQISSLRKWRSFTQWSKSQSQILRFWCGSIFQNLGIRIGIGTTNLWQNPKKFSSSYLSYWLISIFELLIDKSEDLLWSLV